MYDIKNKAGKRQENRHKKQKEKCSQAPKDSKWNLIRICFKLRYLIEQCDQKYGIANKEQKKYDQWDQGKEGLPEFIV